MRRIYLRRDCIWGPNGVNWQDMISWGAAGLRTWSLARPHSLTRPGELKSWGQVQTPPTQSVLSTTGSLYPEKRVCCLSTPTKIQSLSLHSLGEIFTCLLLVHEPFLALHTSVRCIFLKKSLTSALGAGQPKWTQFTAGDWPEVQAEAT